jgi:hypothetical protein
VLLTNARYWVQQERLAEVTDLMVRFPRLIVPARRRRDLAEHGQLTAFASDEQRREDGAHIGRSGNGPAMALFSRQIGIRFCFAAGTAATLGPRRAGCRRGPTDAQC